MYKLNIYINFPKVPDLCLISVSSVCYRIGSFSLIYSTIVIVQIFIDFLLFKSSGLSAGEMGVISDLTEFRLCIDIHWLDE